MRNHGIVIMLAACTASQPAPLSIQKPLAYVPDAPITKTIQMYCPSLSAGYSGDYDPELGAYQATDFYITDCNSNTHSVGAETATGRMLNIWWDDYRRCVEVE